MLKHEGDFVEGDRGTWERLKPARWHQSAWREGLGEMAHQQRITVVEMTIKAGSRGGGSDR